MSQTDDLHDVYLSLGSNIENRKKNIEYAVQNINERIGTVVSMSSLYETDPVGFISDNMFFNIACHIKTKLTPLEVLESTQVIERELGRRSKSVNEVYADRTIDIDILVYDDLIVEYPHLLIPHPHMHERDFVLIPLSEIAPLLIHPILNETISQLQSKLLK